MTVAQVIVIVVTIVVSVLGLLDTDNKTGPIQEEETNVGYKFMYRTSNGIERHEEGTLKKSPTGSTLSVAGAYEYEADGFITIVTYIADENGFKPIAQIRRRINNVVPLNFTLDNRIDPKLLGSLAGGGIG